MTTAIFIASYWKDLPWLEFCLGSINKFSSGFAELVVMVPDDRHQGSMDEMCARHGAKCVVGLVEATGRGNLCQQFYKLCADKVCSSDFILYLDSDCVWYEPVTPITYFEVQELHALPYLCVRPWEKCRKDERQAWEATTDKCIGFKTSVSGMCRHPAVHPRWLLPKVRSYIEVVHRMRFDEFVMSRKADFPQGLSEFNLLSNFARQFYPENYAWIDLSVQVEPRNPIRQNWSHGGLKPEIIAEMKAMGL